MFKINKVFYGLKQAPRDWYERLSTFLIRGHVDNTLFVKKNSDDMIVCQIYFDDIVFCATKPFMCQEFCDLIKGEFKMSMMGEVTLFIRLQIKQLEEGILIQQTKYTKDLLKKFEMDGTQWMEA